MSKWVEQWVNEEVSEVVSEFDVDVVKCVENMKSFQSGDKQMCWAVIRRFPVSILASIPAKQLAKL